MRSVVQEDLDRILSCDLPWSHLDQARVLVSGGSGFLPAYMIETMLRLNDVQHLGIKVLSIVRSRARAVKRFEHWGVRADLEWIESDVCSLTEIPNFQPHFVIHAASQASPKYYGPDPVGTLSANVIGTDRLLRLTHSNGLRGFLYFSSSEVYGHLPPEKIPVRETDTGTLDSMDVRSCYAESKRMGETMCVSWKHQYGTPIRIVRPFHTYGPGMALDDGRVFADFVSDIVHGRNIVLRSSGEATRSFCYLADAVEAFFAVLLKGKSGVAYNVGNPDAEVSVRGLAEILVQLFPEKKLSVVLNAPAGQGYLPSSIQRSVPDIARIQELGWNPRTSLREGFRRTIESYS